jgi:hypothetical protein
MNVKYIIFYLLITASSFASSSEQLNYAVDDYINYLIVNEGVEAVDKPEVFKEEIIALYSKYSDDNLSPRAEDIKNFINHLLSRKILSKEATRRAISALLSDSGNMNFAEKQPLLLFLLHPYVVDSGSCHPSEDSSGAQLCSFIIEPSEGDLSVKIGGKLISQDPSSDLAYILSAFTEQRSTSSNSVSYTNYVDKSYYGNKLVTTRKCSDQDTGYVYQYRWQADWKGLRVWAEAVGFAKLQLATSMADTVFVHIPVGLSCKGSCAVSFISNCLGKVDTDDLTGTAACLARYASKETYTLHVPNNYNNDNIFVQHVQATQKCNIAQADASERPHFKAFQNGEWDDEYELPPYADLFFNKADFRFGTHHQEEGPNSQPVAIAEEGRNLYPLPSQNNPFSYQVSIRGTYGVTPPNLSTGMSSWTHRFRKIQGWHFNLIFNAADAFPTEESLNDRQCETYIRHPEDSGLLARGDQFQILHAPAYKLDQIDALVGWRTYHPAFICASNVEKTAEIL